MKKSDFEKKYNCKVEFYTNRISIELHDCVQSFENISFDRIVKCFDKNYNFMIKNLVFENNEVKM